eukprot:TRINITY_DN5657_c0_g2_i3.p1 TRINITY_DN5657_c0_g2~~TRINITY_DN5657_c0_g2_i3.p1  ORF type:complete len:502 (+),score=69.70 TRINITY_DN5657_c0_g2_i3:53-1507(+)
MSGGLSVADMKELIKGVEQRIESKETEVKTRLKEMREAEDARDDAADAKKTEKELAKFERALKRATEDYNKAEAELKELKAKEKEYRDGLREALDTEKARAETVRSNMTTPPVQTAQTVHFSAKIEGAVHHLSFRQKVFSIAQSFSAYDGRIEWSRDKDNNITELSNLEIELYFKKEKHADEMRKELLHVVEMNNFTILGGQHDGIQIKDAKSHHPKKLVLSSDYCKADTPDRRGWGELSKLAMSLPKTSVYTSRLTAEDVEHEFFLKPEFRQAYKAEWCHIKEKPECTPTELNDTANRLVMDANLHQLFDARGAQGCPGVIIKTQDTFQPDPAYPHRRTRVTLDIEFFSQGPADDYANKLRDAKQLSVYRFNVDVHVYFPRRFASYLNNRATRNREAIEKQIPIYAEADDNSSQAGVDSEGESSESEEPPKKKQKVGKPTIKEMKRYLKEHMGPEDYKAKTAGFNHTRRAQWEQLYNDITQKK